MAKATDSDDFKFKLESDDLFKLCQCESESSLTRRPRCCGLLVGVVGQGATSARACCQWGGNASDDQCQKKGRGCKNEAVPMAVFEVAPRDPSPSQPNYLYVAAAVDKGSDDTELKLPCGDTS